MKQNVKFLPSFQININSWTSEIVLKIRRFYELRLLSLELGWAIFSKSLSDLLSGSFDHNRESSMTCISHIHGE